MRTGATIVVSAVNTLALLCCVLAQVQPNRSDEPDQSSRAGRVSGRLTDENGVPVANKDIAVENQTTLYQRHERSSIAVKTDRSGMFAFSALVRNQYVFGLTEPGKPGEPPILKGIGEIIIVDGIDIILGNIVVEAPNKKERVGKLLGPVTITKRSAKSKIAVDKRAGRSVAAAFTGIDGMVVIQEDGKIVEPPKEPDQVGISNVLISEDKEAVGWLVEYENCCTSYPITMKLVIYRPGKPIRRFGGGMGMWDWAFVEDAGDSCEIDRRSRLIPITIPESSISVIGAKRRWLSDSNQW